MYARIAVSVFLCGLVGTFSSCSATGDDTAEELVELTASGLGAKHPRRISLERELAAREANPEGRKQEAGAALARELARERRRLLDSGLGENHPKVADIGQKIDRLRVYRSGQSRH